MKYFQTIQMQMLKAIPQYLVLTNIVLIIAVYSCKSLDVSTDKTYHIVNTLLDTYTRENDSVYIHPKIIKVKEPLIQDFLKTYDPENIYFDTCGNTIKDIMFNDEALTHYENINHKDEKWNVSKITNPKVFTELKLKLPESIARYKKLSETIKDEYDLLDRKFMLWGLERKERMLKLSQVFFPKQDQSYALCFVSELYEGDFIWIFQKKEKKWKVICKMRLNYH